MHILMVVLTVLSLSLGGLVTYKSDPPVTPNGGVCIDPDGAPVTCVPMGG